jgi:hypothetical protein
MHVSHACAGTQVRLVQNNNRRSALLGAEKEFPELATSMQAAAAAISHGLRFQGSRVSSVHAMAVSNARVEAWPQHTQKHTTIKTHGTHSGVDRCTATVSTDRVVAIQDSRLRVGTCCWWRVAEWFGASHAAAWMETLVC